MAQLQNDFKTGFKAHVIHDLNYFGLGLGDRELAEKAWCMSGGYHGLENESHNRPCCDKVRKVSSNAKVEGEDYGALAPFRFMDLPAELRTWVYRHAVVPGTVSLVSCVHHMPYGKYVIHKFVQIHADVT